jgi:germination protein M
MRHKQLVKFLIVFLAMCTLVGCKLWQGKSPEKPPSVEKKTTSEKEKSETKKKMVKITLYFVDQHGEYLASEAREVLKTKDIAKTAIIELIKGPRESNHFGAIPQGTQLWDLIIKDKIAYVNFSHELIDNHPGGSFGETMTIYSVVNTLTQFPDIEKVQFLVEGKTVETIAGHYDTRSPFEWREDLIEK